tara:strand:- start:312 stop:971 length:660 start_codon:yes stop_codon:yes gene_type:complete
MIAIICARSGSKRIKNKNIINFYGKPIISYPIKVAKSHKKISQVYLSTNSKKIKKIGISYGAKVPYLRSKYLSNDKTSLKNVLKDFVKKIEFKNKYVCCIYPTAALIKKKTISKALNKIKKTNYDLIVAIKEFESDPSRALKINKSNLIFIDKYAYNKNKMKEKLYSDAGSFFIFNKNTYFKSKNLPKKTTFIKLQSHEAVDVNEKKDLELLKKLFLNK